MSKVPDSNTYRQSAATVPEDAPWRHMDEATTAAYFRSRAQGNNTVRTYKAAAKQYEAWCEERGHQPVPGAPEIVMEFLASLVRQGLAPSTIRTRFAGLRWYYRNACGRNNVTDDDCVIDTLHGICRELARPQRQAKALTVADVRAIIRALPREGGQLTLQALRDRALLLVMYGAALRRSEAVALLREDLRFEADGVLLLLRSSKADQGKEGRYIGIGYGKRTLTCPVRSLQAWLDASPGPPFVFTRVSRWGHVGNVALTGKGVTSIVKRLVASIGLDWPEYSSHSLRSGVITDLNAAGVSTAMVQAHSRHKSSSMIPRYHRPATNLVNNYTRKAGL